MPRTVARKEVSPVKVLCGSGGKGSRTICSSTKFKQYKAAHKETFCYFADLFCYFADFAGRCACRTTSCRRKKGWHGGATIINSVCRGPPRTSKDPCLWSLFGPWAVLGCKDSLVIHCFLFIPGVLSLSFLFFLFIPMSSSI